MKDVLQCLLVKLKEFALPALEFAQKRRFVVQVIVPLAPLGLLAQIFQVN